MQQPWTEPGLLITSRQETRWLRQADVTGRARIMVSKFLKALSSALPPTPKCWEQSMQKKQNKQKKEKSDLDEK